MRSIRLIAGVSIAALLTLPAISQDVRNTYIATAAQIADGVITTAKFTAASFASQADQETGTSTATFVSPGRQQFHPSAAKAWCKFDGTTAGTNACAGGSYNVTSVERLGTGDYQVNFTVAMSSSSYACVVPTNVSGGLFSYIQAWNVGSVQVRTINYAFGSLADASNVQIVCFGDQ